MAGLKLPYNPRKRNRLTEKSPAFSFAPVIGPSRSQNCPYGIFPGHCLNGECPNSVLRKVVQNQTSIEREASARQKEIAEAIEKQKKANREIFFEEERRLMGMTKKGNDEEVKDLMRPSQAYLNYINTKQPTKSMRMPARPLCMLDPPKYSAPTGDYAELSRFLRLSTMPGHSDNDNVSEYRDSHNMDVWDGQKDLNRQAFKMKRDWLSVWGEFNVKEQRWRKAWVEKFGAEKI